MHPVCIRPSWPRWTCRHLTCPGNVSLSVDPTLFGRSGRVSGCPGRSEAAPGAQPVGVCMPGGRPVRLSRRVPPTIGGGTDATDETDGTDGETDGDGQPQTPVGRESGEHRPSCPSCPSIIMPHAHAQTIARA